MKKKKYTFQRDVYTFKPVQVKYWQHCMSRTEHSTPLAKLFSAVILLSSRTGVGSGYFLAITGVYVAVTEFTWC